MDTAETTLNEELARLPKEIRYLALDQSVAMKPFTKEEIRWILNVRRTLAIMWSKEGVAQIRMFTSKIDKKAKVLTETEIFDIDVEKDGSKAFFGQFGRGEEIIKNRVVEDLTGRLDTQIMRDSEYEVLGTEYGVLGTDGEEEEFDVYADIIILDIRSIFLILRERFELVSPERAIETARKYTINILNTIVDDLGLCPNANFFAKKFTMQGTKMFVLMGYLMCNATLFDMDIIVESYNGRRRIDDEILTRVSNVCTDLYERIILVIKNMV